MAEKTIKRIRNLPHLGQRIIKTAVAVFLCLVIYHMRGYRSGSMPVEAAITAIVCMQPVASSAAEYALNRFTATLIGAFWGIALILLLWTVPAFAGSSLMLYFLMALGVLLTLYSSVLMRKPDTSALSAITFLCIVIAWPYIDNPLREAVTRIVDIMIGTIVAVMVNIFRLPRDYRRERVFFLYQRDLIPDSSATLSPGLLFQLNNLYRDGARICIQSAHAPAFFAMQLNQVSLALPTIVMDGAAIFDTSENRYVWAAYLEPQDSARITGRLDEKQISYYVYTIHKDRICIFHRGKMRDEEQLVYERMRRSPYRRYLEEEIYDPKQIVAIKVIFDDSRTDEICSALEQEIAQSQVRSVIRVQEGREHLSALYIYDSLATMEHAREQIMEDLSKDESGLIPQIITTDGYTDERDARELLREVEKSYEPVHLPLLFDTPE